MSTENRATLPRMHVAEMVLPILIGILVSIWLSVDPPEEAPAHTSYLPAK